HVPTRRSSDLLTHFDAIIIGFGKAGKTLAGDLAGRNWNVALIEKDKTMYGGTCINIACIPTKLLMHDALNGSEYRAAVERKNGVIERLRRSEERRVGKGSK